MTKHHLSTWLLPLSTFLCTKYLSTYCQIYSKYHSRPFIHTKIFIPENSHIPPVNLELWLKVWALELQSPTWFQILVLSSIYMILRKCLIFGKYFIDLFLEKGEGKGKERERNINVWLPFTNPILGTWSATQALTGNLTGDPLVRRPMLNLVSYPSQGHLRNS